MASQLALIAGLHHHINVFVNVRPPYIASREVLHAGYPRVTLMQQLKYSLSSCWWYHYSSASQKASILYTELNSKVFSVNFGVVANLAVHKFLLLTGQGLGLSIS